MSGVLTKVYTPSGLVFVPDPDGLGWLPLNPHGSNEAEAGFVLDLSVDTEAPPLWPKQSPLDRRYILGKSKFNWWPFAVNMTRDHPVYDTRAGQLTPQERREYNTVCEAINRTRAMANGELRLKVMELTLWTGEHTTGTAARKLNIPPHHALQYRWQFILLVGHLYGFLTEEEYAALASEEQCRHHYYGMFSKHGLSERP